MAPPTVTVPSVVRVALPLIEEEGAFKCPLCEKSYLRAPGLRTHVIERHRGHAIFQYHCRGCDAVLGDTTKRLMETHMRVCPRRRRHPPRPNPIAEEEIPEAPPEDDEVEAAVHDLVVGIRRNMFPSPGHVPVTPPRADASPETHMAARRLEEFLTSPDRIEPAGLMDVITPTRLPDAVTPTEDRAARRSDGSDGATNGVNAERGERENGAERGGVPWVRRDGPHPILTVPQGVVPWDHHLRQHIEPLPALAAPQTIRSATYRRGGGGRPGGSSRRRSARPVVPSQREAAAPAPPDPLPAQQVESTPAQTAPPGGSPVQPNAGEADVPLPRRLPSPIVQNVPEWNLEANQLDLPTRPRAGGTRARPSRGAPRGRRGTGGDIRGTARPQPDQQEGLPPEDQEEPVLTPQQREWMAELLAMEDFDLESVSDVARRVAAAAAVRVEPGREGGGRPAGDTPRRNNERPFQRRPPPARPAYDAAAASALQKLYRTDRKKAVNSILGGPSPYCDIDPDRIRHHLEEMFAGTDHVYSDPPDAVPDMAFPSSNDELGALMAHITPGQVTARLARMACTAPGPDGARYSGLKRTDPGGHVMAAIFNKCLQSGRVPAEWKVTTTVLVYKSGERDDLSNWRPLSLGNTMGKLYAAILADRITTWAEEGGRLSPQQKGFTSHDGCLEHNFLLQTAIDDARREGKELGVAWLDLANAFPSVPHSHLFGVLDLLGMPPEMLTVVRDLYTDASTRAMTSAGLSDPILVRAGVKQGCPLSPIIFNLGMEPLIRSITALKHGYRLGPERVSLLAFADDLALLAENEVALQTQLDTGCEVAEWSGLHFKARKCASLHLSRGRGGQRVQPTEFTVDENPIAVLTDGDHYRHLGVPTGFRTRQTPVETINQFAEDFRQLDESLLAPWQKIDAAATFIMPRMDFIMRGADVAMQPIRDLDRHVKKLAKGWLHLPQRASAEPVFLSPSQGGAGLLPVSDNRYVMSVVQGYRLLTCPDPLVQRVAWWSLRRVASRKIGRTASNEDLAEYLNGLSEGDGGDIACIWSRVRKSTRELKKTTRVDWWWNETLKELQVLVPKPGGEPDLARVHPAARRHLCNLLRTAVRSAYLRRLLAKPDQGKVFEVSTRWSVSNHMMRSGANTRFADWRFLHRARLDCVPLNGARRFGEGDKRCRRCGHPNETLPHVLSLCLKHHRARNLRHHSIVHRLAKAVPAIAGAVTMDRQVPGADSSLRPDVVVMHQPTKKLVIIDVAVAFENRYEAFERIRQEKIRKYEPIANHFRMRGWDVKLDAVVVGALGSWDPANEPALKALRISPRYCKMMRRFIVSDTIRWSRDMYVEHVSGRRQYIVPMIPMDLPGAINPAELFAPPGELLDVGPTETREDEVAPEPLRRAAPSPPTNPAPELETGPAPELEIDPAPVLENTTDLAVPTEDPVEELLSDTSTDTVLLPISLSPSNFD